MPTDFFCLLRTMGVSKFSPCVAHTSTVEDIMGPFETLAVPRPLSVLTSMKVQLRAEKYRIVDELLLNEFKRDERKG